MKKINSKEPSNKQRKSRKPKSSGLIQSPKGAHERGKIRGGKRGAWVGDKARGGWRKGGKKVGPGTTAGAIKTGGAGKKTEGKASATGEQTGVSKKENENWKHCKEPQKRPARQQSRRLHGGFRDKYGGGGPCHETGQAPGGERGT